MQGVVKNFNSAGYGYIIGEDDKEYFVHYTDIVNRPQRLEPPQKVTFTPIQLFTKNEARDVQVVK